MTQYQSQGVDQTIKEVGIITREILASYDSARKGIISQLQALYARSLSDIPVPDRYNYLIQRNRLEKLLAQVDAEYIKWSQKAGGLTHEASKLSIYNNYYRQQYVLDWFTPRAGIGLDFTKLPPELAQLSVTGNIVNWQRLDRAIRHGITNTFGPVKNYVPQAGTLSSLLKANRTAELQAINRAITQGLIRGQSFREITSGVSQVIGHATRDASSGAMAKALRIVRTESIRTLNAGAYANSKAALDQGIPLQKIWISTLDAQTRDAHQSVDGQIRDVDEPFSAAGETALYPGTFQSAGLNINCRCRVADVIDGVPPLARRGFNPETNQSEIFEWKTYEEWARGNGLKKLPSGRWS